MLSDIAPPNLFLHYKQPPQYLYNAWLSKSLEHTNRQAKCKRHNLSSQQKNDVLLIKQSAEQRAQM